MNIFRIVSLSVLSLLLFVSLCFFGIVYSLNKTAFNTDYLNKTVNPVGLIQVVTSSMPTGRTDEGIPAELRASFLKTLKNNELLVNTRMIYAMKEIKHYLLDDGSLPNLHGILDDSLLNKIFVTDLIKNIEMPALVDRLFSQNIISGKDQSDTDKNAIRRAILQTESRLKHELVNAADQTVRYLLSKTSDFRLRVTAKKTFLRSDIIHQFINNIDLFSLGVDILPHELHQLPGDIQLSDDQIRSVVHALEPTIRTSLVTASTDIADYLAGETSDFSASFTITPHLPLVRSVAKEAFVARLKEKGTDASEAEINAHFEQYFANYRQSLPSIFTLRSTDVGLNINGDISKTWDRAESNIAEARNLIDRANNRFASILKEGHQYSRYLSHNFIAICLFTALQVINILLITRNFNSSCLLLGIIFLAYGVSAFIGTVMTNTYSGQVISNSEIIVGLQPMVKNFMDAFISPAQTFSLACLTLGLLLISVRLVRQDQIASVLHNFLSGARTRGTINK